VWGRGVETLWDGKHQLLKNVLVCFYYFNFFFIANTLEYECDCDELEGI
jgi:hypothetical protein